MRKYPTMLCELVSLFFSFRMIGSILIFSLLYYYLYKKSKMVIKINKYRKQKSYQIMNDRKVQTSVYQNAMYFRHTTKYVLYTVHIGYYNIISTKMFLCNKTHGCIIICSYLYLK